MPQELFADNAATTLTSSPSAAGTSFTVSSSTGFPAAATGVGQFRVIIGTELVTVTNVSGTTWTCTALAAGHASGDAVTHVVTAAALGNLAAGGGDYFRSGYYNWGAFTSGDATSTAALALNSLALRPFFVPVRRSFDRIGIYVSAAGTTGAVLRLGIYNGAQGYASTLLLDAGTAASTSTGGKEITITQTLDPGVYWLAVVAQVAACTVQTFPGSSLMPWINLETTPVASPVANTGVTYGPTVSGALPSDVSAGLGRALGTSVFVGLRAV